MQIRHPWLGSASFDVPKNIDWDARAISTSCQLCRKLGHSKTCIDFCCADAKSGEFDLCGFDVVYLAALVGSNYRESKESLLR